jgi:hypothetical protein
MSFDVFPLPEQQPNHAEVAKRLQLQQDVIVGVMSNAYAGLDSAVRDQHGQIRSLGTKVLNGLKQRINGNAKTAQPVLDKLSNAIQDNLAVQQSQLSMVQQPLQQQQQQQQDNCPAWFCISDSDCIRRQVVCSTDFANIPDHDKALVDGPFATQELAQTFCTNPPTGSNIGDQCGQSGSSPPPPPPPPPPATGPCWCLNAPGNPIVDIVTAWMQKNGNHGGIVDQSTPHDESTPQSYWVKFADGTILTIPPCPACVCGECKSTPTPPVSPSLPTGACFPPDSTESTQRDLLRQWFSYATATPNGTDGDNTVWTVDGTTYTIPFCPPATPPPVVEQCPIPPPPSSCPVTKAFTCPDIPLALVGGIPPIGSPLFCQSIDSILKWYADVGNLLWDTIEQLLTPAGQKKLIQFVVNVNASTVILFPAIGMIQPLLNALVDGAAPLTQLIHDMVVCVRHWVTTLFQNCDPSLLLGAVTAKQVMMVIKKWRLGSDAGVWATVDWDFSFEMLDKLVEYAINYACPTEVPHVDECVEAWIKNYIPDNIMRCLLRINGMNPEAFMPTMLARSEQLSADEMIQFTRRMGGSEEDEKRVIRNAGFADETQAIAKRELYWELPTIGDHLEWLRKNVFDDEYVKDFQLMDGFDERFWPKFGKDLTSLGMKKEYAALHYAAHWLNPSFTQLFEMTQRLRKGRVPDDIVFTTDDLLRVMQEQDVGFYFRQRLEAVSHPVINLTLQMKLYGLRVLTFDELVDGLRDLGYTPSDAQTIARGLSYESARLRASSSRGWSPGALSRAFMYGLIGPDFVNTHMTTLGYSPEESKDLMDNAEATLLSKRRSRFVTQTITSSVHALQDAYSCGTIDCATYVERLIQIGIEQDSAIASCGAIDAARKSKICKTQISAIGKGVLGGKITATQAEQQLSDMGITPERIIEYMTEWNIRKEASPQSATAAQIIRWVGGGLLDAGIAAQRLENLGWSGADAAVMLAGAAGAIRRREAQGMAKDQQSETKRAQKLAQLIRQSESQTRHLQSSLRGITSVSRLQSWVAKGLLQEQDFLSRLKEMGYPEKESQLYLNEALQRKEQIRDRRKTSKKGASGNGTAGGP